MSIQDTTSIPVLLTKPGASTGDLFAAPEDANNLSGTRFFTVALITRPEYKTAGLTLAFQIVGAGLGAASNLLIAQLFGVDGRGVISFMQIISINFGMMPFNLGLGMAGSYCLSSGKDRRSIDATVFWSSLVLGCIPLLLLAEPSLVMRHAPATVTYFSLLAAFAVIPPLIIAWNMGYVIIADHRKWFYNLMRIATPMTTCVALIYIAVNHKVDLQHFLMLWFFSNSLPAVVSIIGMRQQIGISSFSTPLLKDMLRFGGMSHVSTLLQMLCDRLDLILVAALLPIRALGLYAVATTVSEVLWIIPQSVSPVLLPLIARSKKSEAKRTTTTFLAMVVGTCVFAAAAIAALAAVLLPRFLPSFAPSVRLIWILLPGVFLSTIVRVLMTDLIGRGSPHLACWPPLAGVVLYLVIGIPVILHWHMAGAAICSDCSYFVACITSVWFFVKHAKRRGLSTLWSGYHSGVKTPLV